MEVEAETLEEMGVEKETENLEEWSVEEEAAWEEQWKSDYEVKAKYLEDLVKKTKEDLWKRVEEDNKKREEERRKKNQEEANKLFEEVRKKGDERFLKRLFVSDGERELHQMIRQWILERRLELSERSRRLIQEVLNYDDAAKSRKLGESESAAALLINQKPSNVISLSNNCQCPAAGTKDCPCPAAGSKECHFSMSGSITYHESYYRVPGYPQKCDVCGQYIPANIAGIIVYRVHPFWDQKFCPQYECDHTPHCCS